MVAVCAAAAAVWQTPVTVLWVFVSGCLGAGLCSWLSARYRRAREPAQNPRVPLLMNARSEHDGVFYWDRALGTVELSTAAGALILGGETSRTWLADVVADDMPRFSQYLDDFMLGRQSTIDHVFRVRTQGEMRWIHIQAAAQRDENRVAYRIGGWLTDATAARETEERLRHEALHDSLTGLPNRARLLHELDHAIARRRHDPAFSYAVLFLDLDGFKLVNDSLGHHAGDALLKQLAERLRDAVPAPSIVARVSGDEFLLLLQYSEELSKMELRARQLASQVCAAIGRRMDVAGREWEMTTSVGIVVGATHYRTADEVLRDADIAMYAAKNTGPGHFRFFDQSMRDRVFSRLDLERDLRRALEADAFVLHYQPIIELRSGRLVGVEALLRLVRPDGSITAPGEFIDLAEQTGIIVPITDWLTGRCCTDLKRMRSLDAGLSALWANINVSARCFEKRGPTGMILRELDEKRLPLDALRVEITESVLIGGASGTQDTVAQLQEAGLALVLDDFGTGYSSLAYLHRFRFAGIKVDRSFVSRFPDRNATDLVGTILTLAAQLQLSVTAEGIENDEQAALLVAMGCGYGQGYGIARPMPLEQLTGWMLQYVTEQH